MRQGRKPWLTNISSSVKRNKPLGESDATAVAKLNKHSRNYTNRRGICRLSYPRSTRSASPLPSRGEARVHVPEVEVVEVRYRLSSRVVESSRARSRSRDGREVPTFPSLPLPVAEPTPPLQRHPMEGEEPVSPTPYPKPSHHRLN